MIQASNVSTVSKESEDDIPTSTLPTPSSTPKLGRRGRGGSFSGPGAGEPEGVNSPGMRRRRSRVPSEEDDKLINYLVSSGNDGSRERNLSVGNIGNNLVIKVTCILYNIYLYRDFSNKEHKKS